MKAASKGHKPSTRAARPQSLPLLPSQRSNTPVVDPDRAMALVDPDDRVLTFAEWCAVNRFSHDTGRRRIAKGAVEVVQLSPKRIGITARANREFHERQTRKGV